MAQKLLSICIPTYAQPLELRRTLDSLIGQNLYNVEIVIRDDNKDAHTEAIVKEFLDKLPIRYFHLNKEGIDRAFIFLSNEASGRFIWWFGDDIFFPKILNKVTEFLKENDSVDFIYINSTDITGKQFSIPSKGSHFYENRSEAVLELRDMLGFCSACLFKKEQLVTELPKAEKFVGSSWVTLFLALSVLAEGESFYFLDGKNFFSDTKPAGEVRWYDQFQVFGINFFLVLSEFSKKFENHAIEIVLRNNLRRVIKAIIVERGMGLKTGFASPSPKILPMLKLYWSYWEVWGAIPLLLLPGSILEILYGIYRKFK